MSPWCLTSLGTEVNVAVTRGGATGTRFTDAAERANIGVEASLRSNDYSVIQAYVAAGLVIALAPESGISHHRNLVH